MVGCMGIRSHNFTSSPWFCPCFPPPLHLRWHRWWKNWIWLLSRNAAEDHPTWISNISWKKSHVPDLHLKNVVCKFANCDIYHGARVLFTGAGFQSTTVSNHWMTIFSQFCNDRERRWVLAFLPSPGVRQPNLAKIYPIHVSKDSLPQNFQADKNMSQPDIIQDHLLPTSKLLKCHGRICEKGVLGYQSLTHTACKPCHLDGSPKCHGNASRGIVKCQRCRGRGTCCVGGWWVKNEVDLH